MSKHFENLEIQLEKLRRHNRQGSFRTRARYYEAMSRFCRFVAERYHLERLANLAPKHLYAYVDYLKERENAPATIKTELSAIRFFHDLIPNPRFQLPDNRTLLLQRRSFGETDRTWSTAEFNRMLARALAAGREDYITLLYLGRYAALRIHECFRLDTAAAERALKEGSLTVKGKGGLVRTVPLNGILCSRLRLHLDQTPRGHKLFVPDTQTTHGAIHGFQRFIAQNRTRAQDPGSDRPMTFHGLRHTRAAEWYQTLRAQGRTEKEAGLEVSRLLGHERPDVTRIYLASLRQEARYGGG